MTQLEDGKVELVTPPPPRKVGRSGRRGWCALAACAALAACVVRTTGDDDDSGGDGDADADACDERNDDCAGETICIAGACEAAFGRRYRFSSISVSIPDRKPDGTSWDALGGAPDPFVEVWLNDTTLVLRTSVVDDVFDASYSETGDATIGAGDSVFVDVLDEDIAEHDPVYGCTADPMPADVLRGRGASCASAGYSVEFAITPR